MDVAALIKQFGFPLITTVVGLITAVFGYVMGIFSDSWKKQLMNRVERKRLRSSLYSELGLNLSNMLAYQLNMNAARVVTQHHWPYPPVKDWLRKEVYDQALRESPVLFHEIKEASVISEFYLAMMIIENCPLVEQLERMRVLRESISWNVNSGRLVRSTMNEHHSFPGFSPYSHPVLAWLRKRYYAISFRNAPKQGTHLYEPTDTTWKKIQAILKGVPKEKPLPR